MNMNPLISVIIPAYNSEKDIADAVRSALGQTYQPIEVIVVDDGSTDLTAEKVKDFGERVALIRKPNGGPASARNAGLKAAQGEFVAFLDADDIWLPRKLEKQAAIMRRDPRAGLVACGEMIVDHNGLVQGQLVLKNYTNKEKFIREMLQGNIVGGGSASLVRRECFEKLGPFDEALRGTEDWDMWLRIGLNYEVRFVEECLYEAWLKPNSVSSPANAEKMLHNELKLLDKIFNPGDYPVNRGQMRKSYGGRYFACARTLKTCGEWKKAMTYMLKSISAYPLISFRPDFIKNFIRIVCGAMNGRNSS